MKRHLHLHTHTHQACAASLLGAALLLGAPSCGGKKEAPADSSPSASARNEQPAQRRQAATQEQPTFAPAPVEVAPLDLPEGVEFPDERRPNDRALAESIVQTASALLQGDGASLERLLDNAARSSLQTLRARGLSSQLFDGIERVRVCALNQGAEEATIALGVQRPRRATLLSLRAAKKDGAWVFQGLTPMTAAIADTVEAFDDVQLAEAPMPEPRPTQAPAEDEAEDAQPSKPRPRSGPIGGIL